MSRETMTVEQGFYHRCAAALGGAHDYKPFAFAKRTRWNNRSAGNGRFPGFGLVRLFGDQVHVQLRAPVAVNRRFDSAEDALAFLSALPRTNQAPG